MGKMLQVGLTGGSGCGKTAAAAVLKELGAFIIDADEIARRCLQPGHPAFRETVDAFGSGILLPDGTIDRKALAHIIFSDPEQKKRLEGILHPRIVEAETREVERIQARPESSIVVTDAALLVETGAYRRYDLLIVVHSRRETQMKRLKEKGLDSSEAELRLKGQLSSEEKIRVADFSIDTDRPKESTRRELESIYLRLTEKLTEKLAHS